MAQPRVQLGIRDKGPTVSADLVLAEDDDDEMPPDQEVKVVHSAYGESPMGKRHSRRKRHRHAVMDPAGGDDEPGDVFVVGDGGSHPPPSPPGMLEARDLSVDVDDGEANEVIPSASTPSFRARIDPPSAGRQVRAVRAPSEAASEAVGDEASRSSSASRLSRLEMRGRVEYGLDWVGGGLHGKTSAVFRRSGGTEVLLQARHVTSGKPKRWPIEDAQGVEVGVLVPRENVSRFSYYGPAMATEVFGLVFLRDPATKRRYMRIALAHGSYVPPAGMKDAELSRIAKHESAGGEGYDIICSKQPVKGKAGRYVLRFGVPVVPSVKNFLIEESKGVLLFSVYRLGDRTCGVQTKIGFSPDIAFALALGALLTTS